MRAVELAAVLVVAVFVFAHTLISRKIENTPITGPIVFVAAGVVLGSVGRAAVGGRALLAAWGGGSVCEGTAWPAGCAGVGSWVFRLGWCVWGAWWLPPLMGEWLEARRHSLSKIRFSSLHLFAASNFALIVFCVLVEFSFVHRYLLHPPWSHPG